MKDVVTASFTGDDVRVSIDVQNGRGPFAPSLNQGFIQVKYRNKFRQTEKN